MAMAWAGLAIAGGIALLYFGADALVRGGAALAVRLGLSPLAVGLTVVSLGTSAPELVVSLDAALEGRGAVAVGNVLGSNVANIGLILGLAAVLTPVAVARQVLRFDLPLLLAVTVCLVAALWDGRVARVEGGLLTAGLCAYVGWTVFDSRRKHVKPDLPPPTGSILLDAGLVVLGLALLVAGAHFLVEGAVTVATAAGVSDAVIGLTVVAFGTSLPELAASGVAAYRGEGDLAVGNVIGSNMFNSLGILGVSSLVVPLDAPDIEWADLAVMGGATAALLPLMWSGLRVARVEGALLTCGYLGYVAWLFVR